MVRSRKEHPNLESWLRVGQISEAGPHLGSWFLAGSRSAVVGADCRPVSRSQTTAPSPSIIQAFGRSRAGCRLQSEICPAFRDLLWGLRSAQLSRYTVQVELPWKLGEVSGAKRPSKSPAHFSPTPFTDLLSAFCFLKSALDTGSSPPRQAPTLITTIIASSATWVRICLPVVIHADASGSRPRCGARICRVRVNHVCRSIRPGAEGSMIQIVSEKVA